MITAVLIVMFFYETSVSESRMHMALRCETGQITEKLTTYTEDGHVATSEHLWDGSISSAKHGPFRKVSGSSDVYMVSRGLLSYLGVREISGDVRAVDPVSALRLRQTVSDEDQGD